MKPEPVEFAFFDEALAKRLGDLEDQVDILRRSLSLLERQTAALERVADAVESHVEHLATITKIAEVRPFR